MAAPKGNQFWKNRSKHGRDAIFDDEALFERECNAYFESVDLNPWYKMEQSKASKVYIAAEVADEDDLELKTPDRVVAIPTARPYSLHGLCLYLGVSTGWFGEFEKSLKTKAATGNQWAIDFLEIVTRVREIVYVNKYEGAAVGAFNANLVSRDLGLVERKDVTSADKPLEAPKQVIKWGDKEIKV